MNPASIALCTDSTVASTLTYFSKPKKTFTMPSGVPGPLPMAMDAAREFRRVSRFRHDDRPAKTVAKHAGSEIGGCRMRAYFPLKILIRPANCFECLFPVTAQRERTAEVTPHRSQKGHSNRSFRTRAALHGWRYRHGLSAAIACARNCSKPVCPCSVK